METETSATPQVYDDPNTGLYYLHADKSIPRHRGATVVLTHAELAVIAQQAYDRFGILAQPWTAVEAERVDRPANLPGESNGHLRRMLETDA